MAIDNVKFVTGRWLGSVALALSLAAVCFGKASAEGQYPDHGVRIVVPFGAGGLADVAARLAAEGLSERLGQPFIIENQPGAGGIAAARAALAGGADGYTLTLLTNATAISAALFRKLPYDPLVDFVPISTISTSECDLVANAASPLRTLDDVLAIARAKPGALNIGTINVGSTQNLSAELFRSMAKLDVVIVPFRSTPDEIVALLRNDIEIGIDFYAALKPSLDSGSTRAIATTGLQRSPFLPAVPTVQEAGLAGFDVTSWNAIYAPAGTPAPVREILSRALHEVIADPKFRKRALAVGIDPKGSTPQEAEARMRADIDKWTGVIERAHIPRQ